MAINYIPNDPGVTQLPLRQINPHADRPAGMAGFRFQDSSNEATHAVESDEFLYWQCREAALQAIDLWEAIDQPVASWQNGTQVLRLIQKVPGTNKLNAFYNRRSLSFFEYASGGSVYRSGASTDVVAHEAGHAFLDLLRPDLWSSMYGEMGAFHEAFGDVIAVLTALQDQQTRTLLVNNNLLRQANFVESTAEDLSAGIASISANHNAAVPRTALNDFQWVLPGTLPVNGGPGMLINEVHSLGMLFTGCFYDTLTNIYSSQGHLTEQGLQAASLTAGRILAEAVRNAALQPRFFREVGNAMIIADQNQNGGVNEQAILDGFSAHNIGLDVHAMVAPARVLAGRAPVAGAVNTADILTRASRRDLVELMGEADNQRFYGQRKSLGEDQIYSVRHRHTVPLDDVSEALQGVVCMVDEDVLVGEADGRAAALGAVPSVASSVAEVQSFVHSLMQNEQVRVADQLDADDLPTETHAIAKHGDQRILTRRRFVCGCHECRNSSAK